MAKKVHQKAKKRRLNHVIAPHNKEPVAIVVVGVLLLALSSLFAVGIVMTKAYIKLSDKKQNTVKVTSTYTKKAPLAKLQASINSVSYSEGQPGFEPLPGQHFLILNVDVVQRLDRPMWLSPLLQSYVLDGKGQKYGMSPVTMDNPFDARSYKVGEHAKGGLSYMVPKNTSQLTWCYEISEQKLKVCSAVN